MSPKGLSRFFVYSVVMSKFLPKASVPAQQKGQVVDASNDQNRSWNDDYAHTQEHDHHQNAANQLVYQQLYITNSL